MSTLRTETGASNVTSHPYTHRPDAERMDTLGSEIKDVYTSETSGTNDEERVSSLRHRQSSLANGNVHLDNGNGVEGVLGEPSSRANSPTMLERRVQRTMSRYPAMGKIKRYWILLFGSTTPIKDEDIPNPRPVVPIPISNAINLIMRLRSKRRGSPAPSALLGDDSPSSSSSASQLRTYTFLPDYQLYSLSQRFRLPYLLIPFLMIWAMANVLLIREQYFHPSSPTSIGCTASVWYDFPPDACGGNGTACAASVDQTLGVSWTDEQISNGVTGRFRCLGGCDGVPLGNPRWVGGTQVNRIPLVIGGAYNTFRPDSWICASAIYSGIVSPVLGGCVNVNIPPFPSSTSNLRGGSSNGIQSTSFLPSFPSFYTLSSAQGEGCLDIHAFITSFNALMLLLTTALLLPSPPVLMSILTIVGYGQIVLISDPRYIPPQWEYTFASLPPVLFVAYWAYKVSFKRSLLGFRKMPLELAIWQGLGFWIGIESSTIFAKLPLVPRLGYDAIPPGGVGLIAVIAVLVLLVVLVQGWEMRKYGMINYYLVRYFWFIPLLVVLANIPNYTLRIHHWFWPLLVIPVMSLPNRISIFGQAIMFGFFLDGAGRWGWAGIIQYTASLIGDANQGTPQPQWSLTNSTASVLQLIPITSYLRGLGVSGFQVIVDDILRLSNWNSSTVAMSGVGLGGSDGNHYFRIAYVANGTTQDFTDPLIRYANGTYDYA